MKEKPDVVSTLHAALTQVESTAKRDFMEAVYEVQNLLNEIPKLDETGDQPQLDYLMCQDLCFQTDPVDMVADHQDEDSFLVKECAVELNYDKMKCK